MKEKTFRHDIFRDRLETVSNNARQTEIAEKIGVKAPTLSKWVNGDATPSINDLLNISRAYGCSIDYLIGNAVAKTDKPTARQLCEMIVELDKVLGFYIEITENVDPHLGEYTSYDSEKISMQFPLCLATIQTNPKEDFLLNQKDIVTRFIYEYEKAKQVPNLPDFLLDASVQHFLHEAELLEENSWN